MRVVHVMTVPESLRFIEVLVAESLRQGLQVSVATAPGAGLKEFGERHNIDTYAVPLTRRWTPGTDLAAVHALFRLWRHLKPDIVHAHTPKGGLLGVLSAKAAMVPTRIYHVRGLPFQTLHGTLRLVMRSTEQVASAAATQVICQSPSLLCTVKQERLVSAAKGVVVLRGSNGVDSERRFVPSRWSAAGAKLRKAERIPPSSPVVGFVGRLVRDKGIAELWQAFLHLSQDTHLLVAGAFEQRDPVSKEITEQLGAHPRVHLLGPLTEVAPVYAASNVIALPTHREGFPNVLLEAAAMERPVVATAVDGCTDAVEDGETGILVPLGDIRALTAGLRRYLENKSEAQNVGLAARARVKEWYRPVAIAKETIALYRR